MTAKNKLSGLPNSSKTQPLPQIPVPIGTAANCQYPVETPSDFNYRIIQDNQRARRIAAGGV